MVTTSQETTVVASMPIRLLGADLKGETLIDNFISVLTNPKNLYANYKNKENQRTMKQTAVVLKRAQVQG